MSNRLPVLLAEIKNANVVFASAQKTTAAAVIVMGKSLIEAKSLCQHGEWETFLADADIPARTAQRYMRIVKSGIGPDYLGCVGLTTALQEIDDAVASMPDAGTALMVTFDDEDEGPPDIIIYWSTGKLHGGFLQAWKEGDKHKCLIIEKDFPAFFIAFVVDVAVNGISDLKPRPPRMISRHVISQSFRDEKLAIARAAMVPTEEGRPA